MKSILVVVALVLLPVSAFAQLMPWWIPSAGTTLEYESKIVEPTGSSGLSEMFFDGTYQVTYYGYDDAGDVCCSRYDVFDPSSDGISATWSPPFKVLDLPLTTGKTWQSESRWSVSIGLPKDYTITGHVVGPGEVTIGEYVLPVIEVTVEMYYSVEEWTSTPVYQNYLLHEQLGDVTGLVSWEGTVAAEPVTWDQVRCLFR